MTFDELYSYLQKHNTNICDIYVYSMLSKVGKNDFNFTLDDCDFSCYANQLLFDDNFEHATWIRLEFFNLKSRFYKFRYTLYKEDYNARRLLVIKNAKKEEELDEEDDVSFCITLDNICLMVSWK